MLGNTIWAFKRHAVDSAKIYSFFHCSTLELLCTLRRSKNVGSSKAKWLVEGFPQPFLQLRKSREGMHVWVSSFDSFSCKMKIFVISRQNSCNTIHNPEFKRLSPAKTALLFYWHAFSFQNRHKAAVKSQVLACIRYQPIISGISPGLGWTESYHVEVAFTWLKLTDLVQSQILSLSPLWPNTSSSSSLSLSLGKMGGSGPFHLTMTSSNNDGADTFP